MFQAFLGMANSSKGARSPGRLAAIAPDLLQPLRTIFSSRSGQTQPSLLKQVLTRGEVPRVGKSGSLFCNVGEVPKT